MPISTISIKASLKISHYECIIDPFIVLLFPLQLQGVETSDQLKRFWIITKHKRGQNKASKR